MIAPRYLRKGGAGRTSKTWNRRIDELSVYFLNQPKDVVEAMSLIASFVTRHTAVKVKIRRWIRHGEATLLLESGSPATDVAVFHHACMSLVTMERLRAGCTQFQPHDFSLGLASQFGVIYKSSFRHLWGHGWSFMVGSRNLVPAFAHPTLSPSYVMFGWSTSEFFSEIFPFQLSPFFLFFWGRSAISSLVRFW